ncbi:O-antigen ligase family protein [Jannaschia rubra]|uniref:Putative O-glycosylation ligase, exosortase A-associated n=1 Tax=Jannaschia rubra TaxID=282197 RepID=A0A0M6XUG4_9RHOB|nr:O-antigen ligase family protein [Jannaschia rubra]CTQ34789.1 putative O-glycosylation ligase, exosortase A-associated [Jannaschia rubra]SFG80403.1 O-antigen ligase like membrane protein [Jannaschia rubra]
MTGFLRFMPVTLAFAGLAALAVVVAGGATNPVAALALPVLLLAVLLLFAQPFLGALALAVFSHLDAIEKLLFGFLPTSAFKLIAAGTALMILLQAVRLRDSIHAWQRNPVTVCAVTFTMMAAVCLVGADNRTLALDAVTTLISLGLLFTIVMVLADTRAKVEILVWTLVATSLVSSLILLAEIALGTTLVAQSEAATTARTAEGFQRSSGGSDYNPTTAASMLLAGVAFALVHMLATPRLRRTMLAVVVLGTAAIVLSFARSAFVAYGVVVILLVWRHRRSRFLPVAMILAGVGVIAAIPFIPAEYFERLGSIFGDGSGRDWTLGRRMTYNLIGVDLFLKNPLFGVGPGNFIHHFTDPDYRYLPGRTLLGRELHNMYLSVLVQYGLLGALPFFAMLGYAFACVRNVCRNPADDRMHAMALALAYGFGAYLMASLFLPNEYTKYTWLLPALCAALDRVNTRELAR